jgi:murein DD-endopeptidase MepM/ murein hydrolase activator NlpD
MSSFDQDRLLAEDPQPAPGTRGVPAPAQGKHHLPVAPAEEKAPGGVAATRPRSPGRQWARPSSAKAEAPAEAKASTTGKAAAKSTAARVEVPAAPEVPDDAPAPVSAAAGDAAAPAAPVADLPAPRGPAAGRWAHRAVAAPTRPALWLAAALVGAMCVSLTAADTEPAHARTATVSESVSVAEELGIDGGSSPIEEITPEAATERLGDLAASRTERDAEQEQAALAQADADRIAAEAAAAAAAEAARPEAVLPVQGARLTSGFGPRWGTMHTGIDLAAPMLTPEYAAMDGIVLEAGPASGFGNAVYIQHENGDVTVYGHMEQVLVTAGQVVQAGDTIALLGNRGQSTGPHLHFEVHVGGLDGTKVDPVPWLRERGVAI